MSSLERYHDAQVIEIVQTSTLKAEFKTAPARFREKAANYRTIGSNVHFFDADGAETFGDATGTDSRAMEILNLIFERPISKSTQNDRRDALHVDQAMQHAVDWFVTEEKAIIKAQPRLLAAGIDLRIADAPEVLAAIEDYFRSRHGTLELPALRAELMRDLETHPVLLGSNRAGVLEFPDPVNGESILYTRIVDGRLCIGAVVKGPTGQRLLTIEPGVAPTFECRGVGLRLMVGKTHLQVGDKTCRNFAVSFEGRTILEGRVARSGHVVISRAVLRSANGAPFVTINRETLTLMSGTSM